MSFATIFGALPELFARMVKATLVRRSADLHFKIRTYDGESEYWGDETKHKAVKVVWIVIVGRRPR